MAGSTLGTKPLTVGSMYAWTITLTKDGATWDLSAQTVIFWWKRPDGTKFSQTATGDAQGNCTYQDVSSQLNTKGNTWSFSVQVANFGWTVPITFAVVNSP